MAKKLFIGSEDTQKETEAQKQKRLAKEKKDKLALSLTEEISYWLASKSRLKLKDKVTFYRLFASMINAGITITKGLSILQDQMESPKMRFVIKEIVVNIEGGKTLSMALREYPKDFDNSEIGMINSGEVSGKLNTALLNLADSAEKSHGITKKLKGAMMYPAVVFLLLIAALCAVMVFVMPEIKTMFEQFDAKLPWATQTLIDMSDFMISKGKIFGILMEIPNFINLIIYFATFVVGVIKFKTTDMGRPLWDGLMLKLPIFGILNQKVAIAKMCRGLATLTSSGVSIVKSLEICAEMVGNELYRRRILRISNDVKIGIGLADNMRGDVIFFPPMVTSMIGVGEKTAQLDKITLKIAEFYEEEVDDMIKNISALLEPIIIVVVGISVGGLVIAVMLPILSLSDLAGGG